MASRKRIVLCYVLLQASFWGMISSICAYQAAIVLDRGFTTGQAGIFCALCYLASLFTQPVIGGWADRHPSVPIKQLLIVMLLPAVALNLVFYFTRPGFALTALIIFLFGVLETNSYPLIDSMGMQYVNAGVKIPYSFARGMGSLTYAVLCVVTGLLTLMGVLISNSRSQAVTETRLEELTREVREHNNFARRVPVVEEQIRVMDRRMTALEKYKEQGE